MPMLRSGYADVFFGLLPHLDQIFMEDYTEFPELWSQVFNVQGSDRLGEDITGFTGFGLMKTIGEGDTFPLDQILPGYSKHFRHVWYALLVEISKLAMADDKFGVFSKVPRALSRTVKVTKETYFWNILNNGLDSVGTENTPDGVSIFDPVHPYVDPLAGTYDNALAADISEANVETALTIFMDTTDDRGKPIFVQAAKVWVSSGDLFNVSRVLDTPLSTTLTAGNFARNDINAMRENFPQVTYGWSPYITDPDSWFVLAEKGTHGLEAYMRQDVEMDHDVDFRTKTAMTSVDMRFVGGASHPFGAVGSSGG